MGIINITNDSFFSDSRSFSKSEISKRINTLITEGADILDIGACSTRPGSVAVPLEEEWRRIKMGLDIIKDYKVPISIDTFRSEIVRWSYDMIGDFIVNDISAGEDDEKMLSTVGNLGLRYIAMHKRGNSVSMVDLCQYDNIVEDIIEYFREFQKKAEGFGVKNWILDPGFGFAKTIEQNYQLIEELDKFHILGQEILVGISRKSFIYKPLGINANQALEATNALHKKILNKGVDILRVHDVAPLKSILEKHEKV